MQSVALPTHMCCCAVVLSALTLTLTPHPYPEFNHHPGARESMVGSSTRLKLHARRTDDTFQSQLNVSAPSGSPAPPAAQLPPGVDCQAAVGTDTAQVLATLQRQIQLHTDASDKSPQ
jgi:hypothetical protein